MALQLADFNMTEERAEFRDMLRRFLEEHAPITEVRKVMEGESGQSDSLWQSAATELGLPGIAIAEEYGGQGFGLKELAIALGETGRALAPVPLFGSAALAARVIEAVASGEEAGTWLRPIAEGSVASLAFVEAGGDWDPAAGTTIFFEEGSQEGSEEGGRFRVSGEKTFVLDAQAADRFFVSARRAGSTGEDGLGVFAVEATEAAITPLETLDLTRPLACVVFKDAEAKRVGAGTDVAARMRAGLAEANALLCAEMTGSMQKVLETAVDYAAERFQFSRAIGSFQAIKHKCADLLIDFEAGRTTSDAAIVALDEGDPESRVLASVAKSFLGPAFLRMATESMQIQGGVGYTWEYDAHLFYRRALACREFLGNPESHQRSLCESVAGEHAGGGVGR